MPVSTYSLLRVCGEVGGGSFGVNGASNRLAAALLTAKRGECALEEADGRREA